MRRVLFTFLLCLFLAPAAAHADPITYSLNILISSNLPSPLIVNGTITTDGKLGPISFSDITAFDFDVYTNIPNFGSQHVTSSGKNFSGYVDEGDHPLTATPSALFFNFSGLDGDQLYIVGGGYGDSGFCFASDRADCQRGVGGAAYIFLNGFDGLVLLDGTHNITNLYYDGGAPTPEPSSLILLATGAFVAAALGLRRRMIPQGLLIASSNGC